LFALCYFKPSDVVVVFLFGCGVESGELSVLCCMKEIVAEKEQQNYCPHRSTVWCVNWTKQHLVEKQRHEDFFEGT